MICLAVKEEKAVENGDVKQIPISEMHEFQNHPFQFRSSEELAEMIESVCQHEVVISSIVRPRKESGYEIMPVLVQNLDEDEVSLIMVDSNI